MAYRIPDHFVDTVLSRLDIKEIISRHVKLRKAGTNYVGLCPFHNEKTPSFTINSNKQFYYCFGCNKNGDAIQFLMELENLSFVESVEKLAAYLGMDLPIDEVDKEKIIKNDKIYLALKMAAHYFQENLKNKSICETAVGYLKSRGILGKTAKEFGIGLANNSWDGLSKALNSNDIQTPDLIEAGLIIKKDTGKVFDRFRNRIMFPIWDKRGRVVGFGGRIIDVGEPKYLNSPETKVFNKSSEIYGLYQAKQKNKELTSLIIVEGYLDVISLSQAGITNTVATLGTALTPNHLTELFKEVQDLIFCFDGDKAGREASKRTLKLTIPFLEDGRRVRFIFMPDNCDPDSFIQSKGKEAFENLCQRAMPWADYLFKTLTQSLDLSLMDDKARAVSLFKPWLEELPQGTFREMLFDKLSSLLDLDKALIKGEGTKKISFRSQPISTVTKKNPLKSAAIQALALLLKNREFIDEIPHVDNFKCLNEEDGDFFYAVALILKNNREISIEALASLLPVNFAKRLNLPELSSEVKGFSKTEMKGNFIGFLIQLNKQALQKEIDRLTLKSKTSFLTSEEKDNYARLIIELDKLKKWNKLKESSA
ncbi:MAG: hypothetical protein JWM09_338 [Francisellaceae bacterium]|nr:hypothetical protein [Francisellaceae bacterium]